MQQPSIEEAQDTQRSGQLAVSTPQVQGLHWQDCEGGGQLLARTTYKPLSEDILARYTRNYHQEYNVEAEAFLQAMFEDDEDDADEGG